MSLDTAVFSSDYALARARFRDSAARAGFELAVYPIDQRGPDGIELTVDVAVRGPERASHALVVSSGLHGIEGYFGSAVQLAWLAEQDAHAPAARRTVLIHALNPYGFAWRRRVNEENVDLNRNFLLRDQSYRGAHPSYRELDGLLNPPSPPTPGEPFVLKAGWAIARRGFRALKNAVAQGQYEFPAGLFFGGTAPSRSARILAEHLPSWIGRPERVLHLDLHSGRGAYGRYALCVDRPARDPRVVELGKRFGAAHVEAFDPRGVLYEIRGALGPWLEQLVPSVQYDCLLAEFGTYGALPVLAALRAENRAHHHAPDHEALREQTKRRLLEAFCPVAERWRRLVLARALEVLRQATA